MTTEHQPDPICEGVGWSVPYFEVQGGRADCPVCGRKVQVIDDRDGSAHTVAHHWDARRRSEEKT